MKRKTLLDGGSITRFNEVKRELADVEQRLTTQLYGKTW